VTVASFSDGGKYLAVEDAVDTRRMLAEGADIIDIGGESDAARRDACARRETEAARVLPVVERVPRCPRRRLDRHLQGGGSRARRLPARGHHQ